MSPADTPLVRWSAVHNPASFVSWIRWIPDGVLAVHRVEPSNWHWRRHRHSRTGEIIAQGMGYATAQLAADAANAAVGDPPVPLLTPPPVLSRQARELAAALNVSGR